MPRGSPVLEGYPSPWALPGMCLCQKVLRREGIDAFGWQRVLHHPGMAKHGARGRFVACGGGARSAVLAVSILNGSLGAKSSCQKALERSADIAILVLLTADGQNGMQGYLFSASSAQFPNTGLCSGD